MKYRRLSFLQPIGILIDLLSLNLAFVGAYYIRFYEIVGCFSPPYLILFWVLNITWVLTLFISRPFIEPRITFNFYKLVYNFLLLIILHAFLIAIFWISIQAYYFSRIHLLITYLILFIIGVMVRGLGVVFLKQIRVFGYNLKKYIVVGYGDLSSTIVEYYQTHREMGYQFYGYFDEKNDDKVENFKGDFTALKQYIIDNEIDYVYCCLPYIDNRHLEQIISFSEQNRSQVKLLIDFTGFLKRGISIEYHDQLPIINLSTKPFNDLKTAFIKRTFDIIFSFLALLLGSPFFILIGIITKLTSKGSIIYKSERIGLWGEKFKIYKFRSMYINADEIADKLLNGDKHSIGDADPRITDWGRIMRKTRLDELPQFLNVLLGDMSIVGPRPLPQYDVDMLMSSSPNDFQKILTIKPGITSIGQIKFGYASNVEENVERMNYDLDYIDNYSLRTDLWLIFQTAKIMVQGKGR